MTRNPAENHKVAIRFMDKRHDACCNFIYRAGAHFVIDQALDIDHLNENLRRNARPMEILRARCPFLTACLKARAEAKVAALKTEAHRERRVA